MSQDFFHSPGKMWLVGLLIVAVVGGGAVAPRVLKGLRLKSEFITSGNFSYEAGEPNYEKEEAKGKYVMFPSINNENILIICKRIITGPNDRNFFIQGDEVLPGGLVRINSQMSDNGAEETTNTIKNRFNEGGVTEMKLFLRCGDLTQEGTTNQTFTIKRTADANPQECTYSALIGPTSPGDQANQMRENSLQIKEKGLLESNGVALKKNIQFTIQASTIRPLNAEVKVAFDKNTLPVSTSLSALDPQTTNFVGGSMTNSLPSISLEMTLPGSAPKEKMIFTFNLECTVAGKTTKKPLTLVLFSDKPVVKLFTDGALKSVTNPSAQNINYTKRQTSPAPLPAGMSSEGVEIFELSNVTEDAIVELADPNKDVYILNSDGINWSKMPKAGGKVTIRKNRG